jgi:DtxR family Mn-dependent transcriptional regulator
VLVQMDGQADGLELPVEVASHIFLVDAVPRA